MIEFRRLTIDDFGPFEHAELDLYRRGLVLIKGDNRDTTAADSNGTGKTTLLRALSWCLFGDTIEGDKTDEVIRKGQTSCGVGLEFVDGEDEYVVRRQRDERTPVLSLARNDEDISGATIRDTQAEIVRLLGMDFKTFRNTVLYGQGDVNKFADPRTTDAERKAVLKKVLRLEVVDAAQKAMGEKRKLIGKQHDWLCQRVQVLEGKAGEIDPRLAEERLQGLATKLGELKRKVSRKEKLEKLSADIGQMLLLYDEKHAEIEQLRLKQRTADLSIADGLAELRSRSREIESVASRIKLFDGGHCPTCTTPIDTPHVEKHVAELRASLVALREDQEVAADVHRVLEQKREGLAQRLKKLGQEIADEKDWRTRHGEVSRELKMIETSSRDLEELEEWAAKCREEIKRTADKRRAIAGELEETKRKIEELDAEANHIGFWCDGFSNAGLVSHILDGVLPELTMRANHHLSVLSDGDIRVRFDTETLLKSGEARDKFDVIVDAEGLENVRPSTGQLKKVTLAADLGLMDLVAARERAAVDLLLLDEVLDGLDASGRARVVDLLMELRKSRSTILVISHDPTLEQLFENVVTIVKESAIARVEARLVQ